MFEASTELPKDLPSSSDVASGRHQDENGETVGEEESSAKRRPDDDETEHGDKPCDRDQPDSHSAIHAEGNGLGASGLVDENSSEEIVITSIRATDVTLGLGRLPAGFHVMVHHSGLVWRTENKQSFVNDVVEWNRSIPIPSDQLATVSLRVYASFEFQPVLGVGEQLREFTTTVEQLTNLSDSVSPPTLFPEDMDIIYPCSSISVTIGRHRRRASELPASQAPHSHDSNTELREEPEIMTNQGHSALSRYRKCGGKQYLEHSIERFEQVLRFCPPEEPWRAAAQSNLAMAQFILCQLENSDTSFEVPLNLYRNALDARPVGHLDRPSTLIQLATVHFAQFKKQRDELKRAQAEALLYEVIGLSSADSHENQAATFMLQLHVGRRVGCGRASVSEQDSTSRITLKDLRIFSTRLLQRFGRFSDLAELQQAITALEELVRYTPLWDDQYREGLANLGVALSYRFNRLGELNDLEGAVSRHRKAANLTPRGHPDKPVYLNNLGNALKARFKRFGDPVDIDDTVSTLCDAVDLTPHDHPLKSSRLTSLADSYFTRFLHVGDLSDIDHAISTFMNAAHLRPYGQPHSPSLLDSIATCSFIRFQRMGEPNDLDFAISRHKDAVEITPRGHPDKPRCLNNLGNELKARFKCLGEQSDLEDAITALSSAVELTPDAHPDKPDHLNNLGNCLFVRFQRLGELSDLYDAISRHEDAISLVPQDHPNKPSYLNNLGNHLEARFERLGELSDLQEAISMLGNAVELTPRDHPHMAKFLYNLGNSFYVRFEHLGEPGDLEDAISALKGAVGLTPHGHPEKPALLSFLGKCLRTRFERFEEFIDLEEAISALRDAVDLAPDRHPEMPTYRNNLGNSLRARFALFGKSNDIEDAISTLRDAANVIPHDHRHKPSILNSLGASFLTRFKHSGGLSDLEGAISIFSDVVELAPHDVSHRARSLNNLGICLDARFKHLGELSDLDDAISRYMDAIELIPHVHPEKSSFSNNLGQSLVTRFDHLGERSDLEQSITLFSYAASSPIALVSDRFQASQNWISNARRIHHHSLLHAYSVAVNLLPQLSWIGLALSHRFEALQQGPDIVREAAAAALDAGLPETAVEWLEQGRSIVWGELFQLRSSYEELSSAHPDHAHRLRELSTALEHASLAREKSVTQLFEQLRISVNNHSTESSYPTFYRLIESMQPEADRHRRLAIERDKLLRMIRDLPGFGQFLRKDFSQLRDSAHSGPVVILNAAENRCDALVVLANVDHAIHVPLPDFSFKESINLQNTLESFVRHARTMRSDEREGELVMLDGVTWESLLYILWKCVVKPVLDALAFSTPGDLSRIFWCPTGPFAFLPIHAAGFYDDVGYSQPGEKVYDFVISSYVPTLSILASSSNPSPAPSGDLRLLAVRQPASDGHSHLPGVATELAYMKEAVKKSPAACITLQEPSFGTVDEVLGLMKEAEWVHFACHGIQAELDSGLCLADGRRLRVHDIIALSRPYGGLAFLSACQTAMGDKRLSEEALHIAAGMLFAGYGGVVGTMWSISDRLAPDVARDMYEYLFRNGTRPDYREAARALHEAMGRLRDTAGVSFDEWLPFIHVGL